MTQGELNPVVERAAKAAYEQFYNSGWPPRTFDAELRTADEWRSAIRAVFAVLREPSEALVEHMAKAMHDDIYEDGWPAAGPEMREHYTGLARVASKAMMDEAAR